MCGFFLSRIIPVGCVGVIERLPVNVLGMDGQMQAHRVGVR